MAGGARAIGSAPPRDERRLEAFRPIRLQKATDAVVAVLIDAIRGGLYQPGDLLPRERDLAERLEVSRPVVRQAIDVLRRAGIVSVKRGPSGGTTVIAVDGFGRVVANLRGELRDRMRHVVEIRRLLDHPVALLAAARATNEELAQLGPLVDQLSALDEEAATEEILRVDTAFHAALGPLTQNPLLAAHYQSVIDQAVELNGQFPYLRLPVERAHRNQRTLFEAIRSRDPGRIRVAVDHHLQAFEEIYFVGSDEPSDGGSAPALGTALDAVDTGRIYRGLRR